MRLLVIIAAFALLALCADCAPFFDAIYDAINGNGRRSYGYSDYGNYYNYGQSHHSDGYETKRHNRQGKSWKALCRVHYPQSVAVPGTGGIICPY